MHLYELETEETSIEKLNLTIREVIAFKLYLVTVIFLWTEYFVFQLKKKNRELNKRLEMFERTNSHEYRQNLKDLYDEFEYGIIKIERLVNHVTENGMNLATNQIQPPKKGVECIKSLNTFTIWYKLNIINMIINF